jgi:hypothetical protein
MTIVLCLVGRALNILPLLNLYNLCVGAEKKIPFKHQLVRLPACPVCLFAIDWLTVQCQRIPSLMPFFADMISSCFAS